MATIDATPANVAAILRARTKDQGGRELGEWTDETRPTLEQVHETIALAEATVTARVGDPLDACAGRFGIAVTYEAACLIEKSYFPEQVESGRSHYDQLRAETDAVIDGVKACQAGDPTPGNGNGGEGASVDAGIPVDICTPPGVGCGDAELLPVALWQRNLV